VYSIHYVIKFVSDLRQVGGFPRGTPASFTNKTDRHDITEILLKLVINTLTLTITCYCNRAIHYFLPLNYSWCPTRNNISTFVSRFTFLLLIGLDKFKNRLLRRHQCYRENSLCASPHLIFLYYTCKKFNQVFY